MPKIEVPPEFAAWSRIYILAFQAATRGSVISLDSSSELAFAARDAGERAGKAQLEAEQRGECSNCVAFKKLFQEFCDTQPEAFRNPRLAALGARIGVAPKKELNDLRCSVCIEPQFDTPSGVVCKNGHGGALGV